MSTWSFADTTTGVFSGVTFSGPDADLAANTPAGHTAWEGVHDPRNRMIVADEVVPYVPTAPADDDYQTWAWDSGTELWVSSPTLLALKDARKVPVLAQFAAIEVQQARSLREIVLAMLVPTTAPSEATSALSDFEAEAVVLRDQLDQIDACTTAEELDALEF